MASSAAFLLMLTNYFYQCPLYPQTNYRTACDAYRDGLEFDFIIVGGGSAGSTLAGRLSENTNWNILLIEAGDAPSNLTEVPATYFLMQGTREDWAFRTQPGHHCLGLTNGQCRWGQGRALGGGSSINSMLAIQGNRENYDGWAALGNPGWEYDTMQTYFERVSSTMRMTHYETTDPLREVVVQGVGELGLSFNQPGNIGYVDVNTTIFQNQRFNAAKGYIVPVRDRTNLCIMTNTRVTKILFANPTVRKCRKNSRPRAIGVLTNGRIKHIYARNEVIVSSGAVNTPKLLMLSGIGRTEHLTSVGIPVIKDLHVGENLQDHLFIPSYFIKFPDVVITGNGWQAAHQFCANRSGPLGSIDIGEVCGFINTKNDSSYPNVQIMHVTMLTNDGLTLPLYLSALGFNEESSQSIREQNRNASMLSLLTALLTPKSRGRILLASADPFDDPLVYPGYLNDPADMEVFIEAINFQNRLITTNAFRNTSVADFYIPNCKHLVFNTREYWECNVRNFATTIFHPVGTSKMGPASDPTAVVGNDLRVHGIDRLRVVDSSIMPTIVSCNTNIPTITIAERAADFIRSTYNLI